MTQQGKVEEVGIYPIGVETVVDAAVGDVKVYVSSISPLSQTGGKLTVGSSTVNYTLIDETDSSITLSEPLAFAMSVETTMLQDPYGEEKKAIVHVDKGEDSIICRIGHGLQSSFPDGVRDPDLQESVLLELDTGGELQITEVLGEMQIHEKRSVPGLSDLEKLIEGIADNVPTEPPTPPELEVYADSFGFTLIATEVEPSTFLTFWVKEGDETVAFASNTQQTVQRVDQFPAGQGPRSFLRNTDYTFWVTAENIVSESPVSSLQIVRRLADVTSEMVRTIAASKVVAGDLVGAFALLGAINVGSNISITPGQGIVINLAATPENPQGGVIQFPSDGSPAVITAELVALALTVRGALRILGTDNEIGQGALVALSDGVSSPTSAPSLQYGWPKLKLSPNRPGRFLIDQRDHTANDNIYAVSQETVSGGAATATNSFIEVINRKTGVGARLSTNNIFTATTGNPYLTVISATRVGDEFYVLSREDRNNTFYFYLNRVSSTGALVSKTLVVQSGSLQFIGMCATHTNSQLMLSWIASRKVVFRRITLAGAQVSQRQSDYTLPSGAGDNCTVNAMRQNSGAMNTYDVQIYSALSTGVNDWWFCFNEDLSDPNTLDREPQNEYPVAVNPNNNYIGATSGVTTLYDLMSDYTVDGSDSIAIYGGRYETYGTVNRPSVQDETYYTFYDGNSGGTGLHETLASPPRTLTHPARTTLIVTVPPLGAVVTNDSPDRVRVYSRVPGGAGGSFRRWTGSVGSTRVNAPLSEADGNGSNYALPTTNSFAEANLTPGRFASGRTDAKDMGMPTTGPIVDFRGDGRGRVGPVAWTPAGELTSQSIAALRLVLSPVAGPILDITGTSPFSSSATLQKYGDLVIMTGFFSRSSSFNSSFAQCGSIPPGYRPGSNVNLPAAVWFNTTDSHSFTVTTAGVINCRMSAARAAAMPVMAVWPAVS